MEELIYRVAFKKQINTIFKTGYVRDFTASKGGNMYGPGVYTTYDFKDTVFNLRTKPEYGDCIMCMKLVNGFKNFIIFDERLAKKYYGRNWEIENQLSKLNLPEHIIKKLIYKFEHTDGELYHGRTAPKAYALWTTLREELFSYGVRGLIYKGHRDGHCALCYDFSSVIPFKVSYDGGKTWKIPEDANTLKNFIENNVDVQFKYNRKYDSILKPINGYAIVKNNNKYNIINGKTDNFISKQWFDYIDGQINPTTNFFVFIYDNIRFVGSVDKQCVIEPYNYTEFCGFDELDEVVDEMKKRNVTNFNHFIDILISEFNDENMNENKKILNKLVNECVNQILMERHTLVDNFDKVAKIMEFNSPDDFYFVQIIKRYKDNKNSDRTKGNYHAGGWYEDSFRVRSVQELMNLKPKIVDLCNKSNARAYITVNNRSETETNRQVIKVKSLYPKNDARHIHAHEIVPGQAKHGRNWTGQRLKFFVDIDSTDKRIWNEVKKIAKMCNMDILDEYETPNGGLHIIFPNKEHPNIEYFTQMLKKFDNWIDKKLLATAHPNFDGKILLYSNVESNGY